MDTVVGPSFVVAATPLFAAFGDALTFVRDRDGARFGYNGQSAVVDVAGDGSLDARFLTAPTVDPVDGAVATGVYRARVRGYARTTAGSARMIADTVAFFSGTREPRFVFVDVLSEDSTAIANAAMRS